MAFFTLLMVVSVQAAIHLAAGFSLSWLGALLASTPMLLVLGWVMLGRKLPAGQSRLTVVTLTMAAGALLAAFDWLSRAGSYAAAGMASLCLAGYAIYQFWYSRLDRSATRIEKGQPLPEFSALNLDDKPVYSRDLLGKPALLMFYRGNWCPFCVVQVKALATAYRELGDRARIVLISPQPAHKLAMPAAGALLAAFDWLSRAGSYAAAGMASLCLAGYAIYQFWYSRLDRSATRIEKGQPLPEFSALNLDDKPVYSRDLLGKPALLMFYRGNWCPFCVVQVKALATAYRELGDRARIVLISPQPAHKTRELAGRFNVRFDFWVDPDNQAATVLGINHDQALPAGMQVLGYDSDTVLPTCIVLAADGTVLDVDETENYRDRPEPDFLAGVLEQHGL